MGQSSSRRAVCHLDRLAAVELHLVMHGLDLSSALQFARCSRAIMHKISREAGAAFAWRHHTLSINHARLAPLTLPLAPPPYSSSRLLRHVAALRFVLDCDYLWPSEHEREMELLLGAAHSGRLVEIHSTSRSRLDLERWSQVLSCVPALKSSLRLLDLRWAASTRQIEPDENLMRLILAMPLLRTLRMPDASPRAKRLGNDWPWHLLSDRDPTHAPALTSLHLCDSVREPLKHVALCEGLRHLSIMHPRVRGGDGGGGGGGEAGLLPLQDLCSSVSLRRSLESLTLEFESLQSPVAAARIVAVCFVLPNLRLLSLQGLEATGVLGRLLLALDPPPSPHPLVVRMHSYGHAEISREPEGLHDALAPPHRRSPSVRVVHDPPESSLRMS